MTTENLLKLIETLAEVGHDGRMALFKLGDHWLVMFDFSTVLLSEEGVEKFRQLKRYDSLFDALRGELLNFAVNVEQSKSPLGSEIRGPGEHPLADAGAEKLRSEWGE